MANMKQPVTYENAGLPVTGLTPTATVERSSTGNLVDNVTVTESSNTSGLYYVNFIGVDQEQYVVNINAGTDSVDNRIQWFSTVAIDHLGGSKGGVIERSVTDKQVEARLKTLESTFNRKLDNLLEQFAESLYVLPELVVAQMPITEDLKPFIQESISAGIASIPKVEMPEIDLDKPFGEVKEVLKGIEIDLNSIVSDVDTSLKEFKEDNKKADTKRRESQESTEKSAKRLEFIAGAFDKFGGQLTSEVVESVVDFWTALEIRKQEATEKINMKDIAQATYKEFTSFKSKK